MDGMIRGEHLRGQDNWTKDQLYALVVDAVESLGMGRQTAGKGFPTLLIVGGKGIMFRDLQPSRRGPAPQVRQWMLALRAAGVDADVWHPEDWPKRILDELRALGPIEAEALPGPSKQALQQMYAKDDQRTKADRQKERQLAKERRTHG